jgi:hypothetical protein
MSVAKYWRQFSIVIVIVEVSLMLIQTQKDKQSTSTYLRIGYNFFGKIARRSVLHDT